ncbi:MAG TPA: hypothetical protein VGH10_12985, partial [Actinomycetota bacterium]
HVVMLELTPLSAAAGIVVPRTGSVSSPLDTGVVLVVMLAFLVAISLMFAWAMRSRDGGSSGGGWWWRRRESPDQPTPPPLPSGSRFTPRAERWRRRGSRSLTWVAHAALPRAPVRPHSRPVPTPAR